MCTVYTVVYVCVPNPLPTFACLDDFSLLGHMYMCTCVHALHYNTSVQIAGAHYVPRLSTCRPTS